LETYRVILFHPVKFREKGVTSEFITCSDLRTTVRFLRIIKVMERCIS